MARRGLQLWWLVFGLALFLCASRPASAQPPEPQQAGLVIVGEAGVVMTTCVPFTEPTLTGLSLLERAGVALTVRSGGGGTAICGIDGLGCPSTDCFCQCKAAPCRYWSYFHREDDGAWRYSARGADSWPIAGGDVDAWVWGDGTDAPPALTIEDICATTPAVELTPSPAAMAEPEINVTPTLPFQVVTPMPGNGEPELSFLEENLLGYGLFALILGTLLGTIFLRRGRRR